MYIERLDDSRLLINIDERELSLFSSSILPLLVPLAAEKAGFSLKSKRFSVHTLPHCGGVFLIITVTERPFLPCGSPPMICARFGELLDVFDCLERLDIGGLISADLCIHRGKYTLLAALPDVDARFLHIFSEYADARPISRREALHIEEAADKMICITQKSGFTHSR